MLGSVRQLLETITPLLDIYQITRLRLASLLVIRDLYIKLRLTNLVRAV